MVPILEFVPAEPKNHLEVLAAQVDHLIAIGVPKEVSVGVDLFRDRAMTIVGEFTYSRDLGAIGLNRICVVHYGVPDRFLAEAGGVAIWADPDKFTLFNGVTVPQGLQVIQGQFGPKYLNVAPRTVRTQHHALEELGIPKEGLTAYTYWENDLLREACMDFPGAVSGNGSVPYLNFDDDRPVLGGRSGGSADPSFGSVSVFRGSQRGLGS